MPNIKFFDFHKRQVHEMDPGGASAGPQRGGAAASSKSWPLPAAAASSAFDGRDEVFFVHVYLYTYVGPSVSDIILSAKCQNNSSRPSLMFTSSHVYSGVLSCE